MRGRRGLLVALCAVPLGLVAACRWLLGAAGYPPEATRKKPPPGVRTTAKKKQAKAPPVLAPATVGNSDNGQWQIPDNQRVLLIFYRGDW